MGIIPEMPSPFGENPYDNDPEKYALMYQYLFEINPHFDEERDLGLINTIVMSSSIILSSDYGVAVDENDNNFAFKNSTENVLKFTNFFMKWIDDPTKGENFTSEVISTIILDFILVTGKHKLLPSEDDYQKIQTDKLSFMMYLHSLDTTGERVLSYQRELERLVQDLQI